MKKLSSSITNMTIVLTVIAVVAGGVLAYINDMAAPQIEKINAENLAAGIKKVIGNDELVVSSTDTILKPGAEAKESITDDDINFVVYTTQDASGKELGKAVRASSNGFSGPLKVLVGFDNNGAILGYTILASAETPGLGQKASLWFQKGNKGDVIGKNPGECNFTVSKDGGDIDAITASTITSRAFLAAVKSAYDQLFAGGADATSGATSQNGKYSADEKQGESKENAKTTEN